MKNNTPLKAVCTFRINKRNVLREEFDLVATKPKQARFEAQCRMFEECDWMIRAATNVNRIKLEIK